MAPRPELTVNNGTCLKKTPLSEMPAEDPNYKDTSPPLSPKARTTSTPTTVPPDGGWGWMVLLGTMTINIVVIGHVKSFGVYFKTLMDEFDASPSRVAWLQSLQIFMFSFLSPLASILSQIVGPRKVALVGGLMAFGGLTVSSLTPSLEFLYIFFGVVQGIALTFTFIPGITMIAKYFHRRRGLANGLTMAGNALGGIIMPLVADRLISEYALRGCFLIIGSLLLNACVGAMLWQPVEWHLKKTPRETVPILEETLQSDLLHNDSPDADNLCVQDSMVGGIDIDRVALNKENSLCPHQYESGLDLSIDSTITVKVNAPEMCVDRKHINMYASGPNLYSNDAFIKVPSLQIPRGGSSPYLADPSRLNDRTYGSSASMELLSGMFNLASRKKHDSRASSFLYLSSYSFGPTAGAVLTREHFTGLESTDSNVISDDLGDQKQSKKKRWTFSPCLRKFAIDRTIFEKSRFYFMTFSLFFHVLGYQGTQLFLPYRATTLGLSQAHAASFLSVLSFTDLVGRITCAWISDFHLCPRKYWFIGGMFMSGVFAYSLPFYNTYATLLVGSAGFGFCCGSYIGLVVVLFADAYNSEQVALAYSVSTVSGGFMALGGAPLMGYVLESTESYMICQAILGSAQFAGAAVWLAEPWASRYEKRRRDQKNKMKSPEEEQLV